MLTTEIQQDTHSGPVTLNPRWLRIPAAVKYFGTFPVETLRIAFRKENPIDLFEVSQGSGEGRETSGQGVDRHIHVSFAV